MSHPEPVTLPRYIRGVKNITVKMAYPKRATELLMNLAKLGLDSKTPVPVGPVAMTPYDFARHYFFASDVFRQTETWKGIMEDERAMGPSMSIRVEVEGEKDRRRCRYVYRLISRDRNRPVYSPAVVGLHMVATGKIGQRGVVFPEDLEPEYADALLDETKRHGVEWESWEEALP